MKRAIDVSTEVREGIRKTFKVSDQAIWLALTFDPKRGMSDKAKRIRQYAKINGGVETVVAEKVIPCFSTMKEASDNTSPTERYWSSTRRLAMLPSSSRVRKWYLWTMSWSARCLRFRSWQKGGDRRMPKSLAILA